MGFSLSGLSPCKDQPPQAKAYATRMSCNPDPRGIKRLPFHDRSDFVPFAPRDMQNPSALRRTPGTNGMFFEYSEEDL
jgi:hypothetical protein